MVFLTLDDPSGGGEVVVFNSTYAHAREHCVPDRVLIVKGRVDHKQQGETKLLASEVRGRCSGSTRSSNATASSGGGWRRRNLPRPRC
jgi:DNA polymerase-3 subunit alpha